jgi:hypothetical protein
MTKTTKTILLVIVGVVILSGITIVGLGVWFVTSALDTVAADEAVATQSFADVRSRFEGREPILAMTDRGPVFAQPPPETPQKDIENIRLIAWDRGEEQLASFTIPFWLVRMRDGPFSISASTMVPNVKVSVRARDLERYGPALLIDQIDEDGSRVLIWTE